MDGKSGSIYQKVSVKAELIWNKEPLPALTSLRFFFAMAVFCSHLGFLKDSKFEIVRNLYSAVFAEGFIGVSFFFILSGFILTYNYADQFRMQLNRMNWRAFIIARIARIYPLHIITLLISIPLLWIQEGGKGIQMIGIFVLQICLSQSLIPIQKVYFSFNAPSWSISDEFIFYLLLPII